MSCSARSCGSTSTARDAGAYGIPKDNPFAEHRRGPAVRPGEQDGAGWLLPSRPPGARSATGVCAIPGSSTSIPNRRTVPRRCRSECLGRGRCLPRRSALRLEPGLGPQRGRVIATRRARACDKDRQRCQSRTTTTISGDCSITGMGVYRGQESTTLDGIYFNSDFCSGKIYGLEARRSGAWHYQVAAANV